MNTEPDLGSVVPDRERAIVNLTISLTNRRLALLVASLLCCFGLIVPAQTAYAAPTISAPWDSGKTFAVGNPPNSGVGGGYYGHCCGQNPDLDYYAVDINGPGGGDADCGENVRATDGGTISTVGTYSPSNITYLRINHGGGYTSEYQHITSPLPVNTPVNKGDVIAKIGNKGTTYCHLHFVVKLNGTSVPPSPMSGVNFPASGGIYVTSDNASGAGASGARIMTIDAAGSAWANDNLGMSGWTQETNGGAKAIPVSSRWLTSMTTSLPPLTPAVPKPAPTPMTHSARDSDPLRPTPRPELASAGLGSMKKPLSQA